MKVHFSAVVSSEFSFLESEYGFSTMEVTANSAIYGRGAFEIVVGCDPRYGEVELALRSVPNANGQRMVSLSLEELRRLRPSSTVRSTIAHPRGPTEFLNTMVHLAQELRRLAAPFLEGDEQWLASAYEDVLTRNRTQMQEREQQRRYETARDALRRGDYARTIAELGDVESLLSPKSLQLLSFAQKQIERRA
jgi:hypothetical protein